MIQLNLTPDPKRFLDFKLDDLIEKRTRLLRMFSEAAESHNAQRMGTLYRRLREVNEFVEALHRIQAETRPNPKPGVRRYAVSSYFLYQCYRELTADASEQLFFVTGSEVDGVLVLDQKAEFQHQKRNVVSVIGDSRSTHNLLIKLEQFGHRLLAHFHSHPGTGLNSTHPSGTDERYQRRLEDAGFPTVAAIFSRDGYIRFFRLDSNLEIQIHGKGVQDLGNHTYRLTDLNQS